MSTILYIVERVTTEVAHGLVKLTIAFLEVAQFCYEARQRKGSEPA